MNFYEKYKAELIPVLMKKLGKDNVYSLPKITKISVNIGVGSYLQRPGRTMDDPTNSLSLITLQKPAFVKARKSVSEFKLKKGSIVGLIVTIRGEKRIFNFLNKLINLALPNVRDFKGLSKRSFDKNGNYSVGINDISVFPGIRFDDIAKVHGCQINFSISSDSLDDSKVFLETIGIPFRK